MREEREIRCSQKSFLRKLKVIFLIMTPFGGAWDYLDSMKKDPKDVIIEFLNELVWQTIKLGIQCNS